MRTVTPSNSITYLATIGIFCVLEFALSQPTAQAIASWRLLSRQASENLKKKNYQAAESGYERAIDSLKSENSKADEIYSLQLLLVETYRQSGKYHKAREILLRMEPAIKAEKYIDPTVAVRFWRRMAEVESSAGSKKKGLLHYRKSIAVLEKYFEPNSSTLQRNYASLLFLATEESDYDTIVETLNKFSESAKEQNIMANGAIVGAFHKILTRVLATAESGNYKEASRQIKAIKGPSYMVTNRADLWKQYAQFCMTNNHIDEAEETVPILLQLSDDAKKKLPLEESVPVRMSIHLTVATVLSKGNPQQKTQCVPLFRKALNISNELKPPLPFLVRCLRVLAIEGIATAPILMSSTPATDEAVKLMQEPIELSVIPPKEKFAADDLKGIQDTHITSRLCLALIHLSRKDPIETEKALESIDGNLMKKYPPEVAIVPIANFYVDIAKLYMTANKNGDRDRVLNEAKKLIIGAPASPALNSVLEKCRTLEAEIKNTPATPSKGTSTK